MTALSLPGLSTLLPAAWRAHEIPETFVARCSGTGTCIAARRLPRRRVYPPRKTRHLVHDDIPHPLFHHQRRRRLAPKCCTAPSWRPAWTSASPSAARAPDTPSPETTPASRIPRSAPSSPVRPSPRPRVRPNHRSPSLSLERASPSTRLVRRPAVEHDARACERARALDARAASLAIASRARSDAAGDVLGGWSQRRARDRHVGETRGVARSRDWREERSNERTRDGTRERDRWAPTTADAMRCDATRSNRGCDRCDVDATAMGD